MDDLEKKIVTIVASTLFISLSFIAYSARVVGMKAGEEIKKQRQEIARLEKEFQENITRAKWMTVDPCVVVFYEFVTPPTGLGGTPKLIMMGQEISYIYPDPSTHFLFLLPKGDRVELMMMNQPPDQLLLSTKIGEKYSPDSKFCQEQK